MILDILAKAGFSQKLLHYHIIRALLCHLSACRAGEGQQILFPFILDIPFFYIDSNAENLPNIYCISVEELPLFVKLRQFFSEIFLQLRNHNRPGNRALAKYPDH